MSKVLVCIFFLNFEQPRRHVRVEVIIIEQCQKRAEYCDENGVKSADIRQDLQQGVALSQHHELVWVHLNRNLHYNVLVFLIGARLTYVKLKNFVILVLSPIV